MSVDRSALPRPGPDPVMRFPRARGARLAEGLSVLTAEHRDVPILALLLLVPGGSASDPADRPGLAALMADLLDEGAGGRSGLEVHDALARLGAQLDTEVGADATLITLITLARHRDAALRLLGEIAFQPRFDPADFERVRDLRRSRLAQLRDVPGAVAERAFLQQLYGDHPYGHLSIGTEASLAAVTLEDVAAFHRDRVRLDASTLVAVGDASHDEIVLAVSREFVPTAAAAAGGSSGAAPPGVDRALPEVTTRRVFLVDRPLAPQSELRVGRIGPPRQTADYFPLVVLNTVLGGQFVSRINTNLREQRGYTYGARTVFDFRRGAGPFIVQTSVQSDATAESVREILRELDDIRGPRPVTAEELALARAALTRGYPRNFETAEQVARAIVQLELYGLPPDYFDRFVGNIEAVGPDDVTGAARTWLEGGDMMTVVVGDGTRVAPALEALGLAAVTRIPD